jgi:hypothetical protein
MVLHISFRSRHHEGRIHSQIKVLVCFRRGGEAVVVRSDEPYQELGRNPSLGPMYHGNPVWSGRRMYVRSLKAVFCTETGEGAKE